jgi:dienelactone hydrolase
MTIALLTCIATPAIAKEQYGPPPDGAAYWTVPAWHDRPLIGPQQAPGIVFWNHGVNNKQPQYQFAPPATVRRFANSHWDIVKIQRNPRYENGWSSSGVRHVEDLVARAEKAKAEGYRMVVVAGQSYGGAIALEASTKTAAIDAVLAMSPGYGSDVSGTGMVYQNFTGYLIAAIERSKAKRIVVVVGALDALHPFETRGPKLRAALAARGKPFIVIGEDAAGLRGGHDVGYTREFTQGYSLCVARFLAHANATAGETTCIAPPS